MIDKYLVLSKLQEEYEKSGLSYERIEKMTGLSHSSVQRYITGRSKKIPFFDLVEICNAIGCDITEIISMVEETGYSEKRNTLISLAERIPESKVQVMIDLLQSFLEDEKK